MTVRVYKSTDSSAPVLSGSVGAIVALLSACLVDGYGSATPAGWSKTTGTNIAAYRQGGGNMLYLRVDNTGSVARLVGYESMSDVDTGTNPFPTEVQSASGLWGYGSVTTNATARPWVLVADDVTFYLFVAYDVTTAAGMAGSTTWQPSIMFGDIASDKTGDTFNTAIIANSAAYGGSSQFAGAKTILSQVANGHFMARGADQSTMSTQFGKHFDGISAGVSSAIGASGTTYPDPVTGGLRVGRILCNNGSAVNGIRGHLRGLWAPLNALPGTSGDTVSGTGSLAGRTFMLLDSVSDGSRCRVAIETSDTWD